MAEEEELAPVDRLALGDEEPEAPVEGVAEGRGGEVGEPVAGSDMVAASPLALVTVAVALAVTSVAEAVEEGVGTEVDEALTPGGSEVVGSAVTVEEDEGMPDVDAETPTVCELVAVMVPEGVAEPLTEGAAVTEGVEPRDMEELAVCEPVGEPVGRIVSVAVADAEAPGGSELVGVSVAVTGADCVSEAEADQVLLAVVDLEGVAP